MEDFVFSIAELSGRYTELVGQSLSSSTLTKHTHAYV